MKDPLLDQKKGEEETKQKKKTVRNAGSGKRPAANNAYKYRLYPDDAQSRLIAKTFGCCRLYWNLRLEDSCWAWREYKIQIWPEPGDYRKDERYAFMAEIDQQALQNVKMNQRQAFLNFFYIPPLSGPSFNRRFASFPRSNNLKIVDFFPISEQVRCVVKQASCQNTSFKLVFYKTDPI